MQTVANFASAGMTRKRTVSKKKKKNGGFTIR
jgi:hypothetical protein